jgi:hypothetical protein
VKRRLLTILIFLLAGAVVNVAVAWTCALTIDPHLDSRPETVVATVSGHKFQRVIRWSRLGLVVEAYSRHPARKRCVAQACGWPMLTLWGETKVPEWDAGGPRSDGITAPFVTIHAAARWAYSRALPFRPLWPGFAVNTLLYAAVLWPVLLGLLALLRFIRRRRGLCPACAYPMGEAAVCTECGRPLPGQG